jgi:hypothetical protein
MLGSLAGQYGGLNTQMNANNFNMGMGLNNQLYGRMYGQNQQGFQNAMGLNQAGLQTMGSYGGMASNLLGGGMGIDNAMLQQMQTGAGMGAERTGAAVNAGNTSLQGMLAQNNTNAAGWNNVINGLSNANWGGLFGNSMSNPDAATWGSGAPANNAVSAMVGYGNMGPAYG